MKKLDKKYVGKNREIEIEVADSCIRTHRKMPSFAQKYVFNIFFVAFVSRRCGIYHL